MIGPTTDSEYLLIRKTSEEYRSNGYEVQLAAVLDFLPNFQADLLVRKGDEVKVIEVKSRPSLAADPKPKPGWDVHLLGVENQARSRAGGLVPLIAGWYGSTASPLPVGRPVRRGSRRLSPAPLPWFPGTGSR